MRRILFRSMWFGLAALLLAGGVVAWRAFSLYSTVRGGISHVRYLLESGEELEGAPAEDVLSDNYLLSLFGNNPELVSQLKKVIDLGMATDASLKLGNVAAMVVTYRQAEGGDIHDAAIYAIGGFPDPKSRRIGFHAAGYIENNFDPTLANAGNALMHLLGRDIIVFCENDRIETHMELLFDLLNGRILPLAQRVADEPLHYSIVFPEPSEIAPPNLKNAFQTILVRGTMAADTGSTDWVFLCKNPRDTRHVHTLCKDALTLARGTFHDRFGGYIKQMPWGPMNDNWWATEYVSLIDATSLVREDGLVSMSVSYDRIQNNAILKTVERVGRDVAAQKAFALASQSPWEFAFANRDNPRSGYWSHEHLEGPDWPLGDLGIPTPGSIAAAKERERIRAEKEAAAKAEAERKAAEDAEAAQKAQS